MRENTLKNTLKAAGITFILIFFLTPVFWMIAVSLTGSPEFLAKGEFSISLQSYIDILTRENLHFMDYLKNSLIIAGISSVASVLIGSFAAYAISRFKFKGRIIIVLGVLALSMFPQISMVGYIYKFMTSINWVNTYGALIFPYIAYSLPLALWILLSYFSQIPDDLDRAALIDGASRFQILTKIILPLTLPGMVSAMLLLFMFAFNEFLFALMLTTDYHSRTVPVGIALFQGLHGQTPWGQIMAASVISCIPVILIALFTQKYIVQGLTGGAVKE